MKTVETSINRYIENPVIMGFLRKEALVQVAKDMNKITKGATTAKGIDILSIRHKNIENRINRYISVGVANLMIGGK